MKANAIIRILIWSVVIVVLLGVLIAGVSRKEPASIQAPVPTFATEPAEDPAASLQDVLTNVPVISSANVYSVANEDSQVEAVLDPGQLIIIDSKSENDWIFTTDPNPGWVKRKHLDMEHASNATVLTNTRLLENPQTDSKEILPLSKDTLVYVEKMEAIQGTLWAFVDTNSEKGWMLSEHLQTSLPTNAEILNQAILRDVPSQDGQFVSQLEAGVHVRVEKNTGNNEWAYITRPETGWVPMKDLQLTGPTPIAAMEAAPGSPVQAPESTVPAASSEPTGDTTALNASKISSISVEWVAGNIVLEPWDGDTIRVSEEGVTDSKYEMHYKIKDKELDIKFCQEKQLKNFSLGIHTTITKDLLIQIPRNWTGQELEIDAAAANLEVTGQTFREVEIDGASGTCLFENCTFQELDLDTASGDVEFRGQLHSLDFDAASASFKGILTNVPKQIDMDSMSGNLDLTLPEDAGFSVKIDGMTSDFSSEFPVTIQNGRRICGDGRCRIDVNAMSGNVTIRKAS